MFNLRFEYSNIFQKIWKQDFDKETIREKKGIDNVDEKVYKIKYQLNILPSVSEDEG